MTLRGLLWCAQHLQRDQGLLRCVLPQQRTTAVSLCMCAADKPVNSHSPPKDVAALLLAVAEKLWLETAEQAHSPQSSDDSSKATNIIKTKVS